jgi:S1-C subfamily serine protease
MIGFNYGYELAKTSIEIKSQLTQWYVSQEPYGERVLYSIPTLPGSSGNPIIDKWGNLVAINYAKTANEQGFNFGIPINYLIQLYNNTIKN